MVPAKDRNDLPHRNIFYASDIQKAKIHADLSDNFGGLSVYQHVGFVGRASVNAVHESKGYDGNVCGTAAGKQPPIPHRVSRGQMLDLGDSCLQLHDRFQFQSAKWIESIQKCSSAYHVVMLSLIHI